LRLVLDTCALGCFCHPNGNPDFADWFERTFATGRHAFFVPALADFALRRELLLCGFTASIAALNSWSDALEYIFITRPILRLAERFWADARRVGNPTEHQHALASDVIIAAQAEMVGGAVITENTDHLSRYVQAINWRDGLL
jgi:hypothetical protein